MKRRALSLVELMLGLAITGIVAAAIAGMLGAVSSGVGSRRDARSVSVLTNAAATRLASYVVPGRAFLQVSGSDVVLWLNDSRESNTVHATEIRWLRFDAIAGNYDVHYVDFPTGWTQAAKDLEDLEYSRNADWSAAFTYYDSRGWMKSRTLVDQLDSVSILLDERNAFDSRLISFELAFVADGTSIPMLVSARISQHMPPTS